MKVEAEQDEINDARDKQVILCGLVGFYFVGVDHFFIF